MTIKILKRDQELFRAFFLGGGYTRSQFSELLGISPNTYDKAMLDIRLLFEKTEHRDLLISDRKARAYNRFKIDYFRTARNFLTLLYRTKSLKRRDDSLAFIINSLRHKWLTLAELQQEFENTNRNIDEKTLRNMVHELEGSGVLLTDDSARAYKYCLDTRLYDTFDEDELTDIYDFIIYCASTAPYSVPGYFLSESIGRYLYEKQGKNNLDVQLYKYNYFGRVLDEYICYDIIPAIQARKPISLVYYTKEEKQRYSAQQTNAKYVKDKTIISRQVNPLRILYDHQYGRWYLAAWENIRAGISKFRMENIESIKTLDDPIPEEEFQRFLAQLTEETRRSWAIDSKPEEVVEVRFYFDSTKSSVNFIKHRVQLQGQWGEIIEEAADYFIYRIKVNGINEIKPWIRSFGASAEVLKPEVLRLQMAKEWEEVGLMYETI